MDEFRADIRKKLEEAAQNKAQVETENAVVEKVIENAEFDIPEAMIEANVDNLMNDFAQRLTYQGLNLETYLKYTGMSAEAMRENFKPEAVKKISGSLVLTAIKNAEGIETGEEELELHLVDMAKKYGMELDKLKELISEAEMENLKNDLAIQKTITMLANNAVVVDKK